MSLIRKQQHNERQRISIALPQEILTQVDLYAKFIESSRDHVTAEALRMVFEKDKAFTAWMKENGANAVVPIPSTNGRRGRPKKTGNTVEVPA